VHLQTRSITASQCISEFTQSRSPIASPTSLDHGLKVHVQTPSISASECISEFTRFWPPSASLSSLYLGLQVHLSNRSITACKYIVNERRQVYGDTGVMEVDRATGSTYSGAPWVARHLLIFISSGSTQLRGFSQPGSIISSHYLPRLLELEPFLLTNSVLALNGRRQMLRRLCSTTICGQIDRM